MKKIISLLLVLSMLIIPGAVNAEESLDLSIDVICNSEKIEVGDQFIVSFKMDKPMTFLTFQMAGSFTSEFAEIVAPVYTNEVLGILQNDFNNAEGTFKLVGYDRTISGTNEEIICSILFVAKKAGAFNVTLSDKTMLGKANENAFYVLGVGSSDFVIEEDTDNEAVIIIEDTPPLTPFEDMFGYDWAEKSVAVMVELGALEGIADELFYPDKDITRGEFVTMLMRLCKQKTTKDEKVFADVSEDSYQYEAIKIAKALGIAKGDGNDNFNPDATIKREDAFTLIYRTMLKMNKVNPEIDADKYLSEFSDSVNISEYAKISAAGVVRAKLVEGDENGLINPKNNMTRAEAAVLLDRLCEYNVLISR